MIDLSRLENAIAQEQESSVQQSSLAQLAMETAQQNTIQQSEDVQAILNEMQAARERDAVRRRLATYQYACGGNIHAGGGSIHIDPSKRGTFTAAASRHGMGVQAFASKVLANKGNYSPAMVKKANFARNASRWHANGGNLFHYDGLKDQFNSFSRGGYIEDGLRSLGVTGFRVTSGYRGPNSKVGHAGKRSGHARTLKDGSSGAIDIVPTDKSARGWAALERQLRQHSVQRFLASFGGTVLAETDPATMKKTGATGPHFHIGLGVRGGGNFYNSKASYNPGEQSSGLPASIAAMMANQGFSPIQIASSQQQQLAPWWAAPQQSVISEEVPEVTEQQQVNPFAVTPGMFDLGWDPINGRHQTQSKSSYPALFADGGYLLPMHCYANGGAYNDDFMNYYGYRWVPARNIKLSDPYWRQIQEHDPNATYAVDSDGWYVPASTMERQWELYNEAPSVNTPATAYELPEFTYVMQDKDKAAIDNATRLFGDSRDVMYDTIARYGDQSPNTAPVDLINKIDTISRNSGYMNLITDPDILQSLVNRNLASLQPGGRFRAQYKNGTTHMEANPFWFLQDYIAELSHEFQHRNKHGINLEGYDPRDFTDDRAIIDNSYNDPNSMEYKAHKIVQPELTRYLFNPAISYNQFLDNIKSRNTDAIAKR